MPNTLKRARPDVAPLHRRIEEHPGELSGEQDRGGLAAREREHARKLAAAPVGLATTSRSSRVSTS